MLEISKTSDDSIFVPEATKNTVTSVRRNINHPPQNQWRDSAGLQAVHSAAASSFKDDGCRGDDKSRPLPHKNSHRTAVMVAQGLILGIWN